MKAKTAEQVLKENCTRFQADSPIEEGRPLVVTVEEAIQAMVIYHAQFREASSTPQRWIPVEDRLPAKFRKVLLYGSKGNVGIGCVDSSGEIDDYSLWEGEKATHWCDLPSPPVESKTKDQD